MSPSHALVALTTSAALLLAPLAGATASTPAGPASRATASVAKPVIQGVVSDQFGRYVDDVQVQATKGDGTQQASALTYASSRPGGPQHGYFFLEVTKGTYTLTLTRSGYVSRTLEAVAVTRRGQRISLHEVVLHKRLPGSRTTAAPRERSVTTRQHGIVEVHVAGGARPTGDVEVREGRRVVGEGTLRGRDKGTLRVELGRLGKGRHELRAVYLGSTALEPSSSKAFTLGVTKPGH